MKKNILTVILVFLITAVFSQSGLVGTQRSPYARMSSVGLQDVKLTGGFWADRFAICRDVMVPQLWKTYTSRDICYAFQNFRIAAGLDTGSFRGPSFHDGDFYKTLEAVSAMYAATHDRRLNDWLEEAIAVIAKAQKPGGYIYTKNIIEQHKTGQEKMFDDRLSFEAYNFGHLMTAACVHYRATGSTSLLDIAKKAAGFLIEFYAKATPEQARNAICPSHYMGLVELYRTTGDKRFLRLAIQLIDRRGEVEGTDDNSDRAPFREMNKVAGHAVRANYLFAGAADVYAEDGDKSLMTTLDKLWNNVVNTKMYITGGCGALYDGVSVDGISYQPDTVQKVHQSYGKDFQLPNFSAHNETCANIGNVMWNWRMFLLTGETKYADIVELALYNSVLSGVSIDGKKFFYTNPLAASADYPYHLRWEGGRTEYISKSNCCPPNLVRTLAEVSNYFYSTAEDGLYINIYGSSDLHTELKDGRKLAIRQETAYPWNGKVDITVLEIPATSTGIHLRLPGWCRSAGVKVNGKPVATALKGGQYYSINRAWKKGDKIELIMEMPAVLIESNPLVEETRNQAAVKRGPIVYCLESADLPGKNVFNIMLDANEKFTPVKETIDGAELLALTVSAEMLDENNWSGSLYRELNKSKKPVTVRLIPYYAWANRGRTDMTVWLPVIR